MKTQKWVGDDINELVDLAAKPERENAQLNVQLEEKIEKIKETQRKNKIYLIMLFLVVIVEFLCLILAISIKVH